MTAHPPGSLTLLLMAGPPGSGKTTLALALSQRLAWPVIDKDTIKSPLLRLGVPEEISGPASYELLFELAEDLLVRQRLSVVLDSPAGYERVVERARTLACAADAALRFVLCLAPRELRSNRLRERPKVESQWTTNAGPWEDGREHWRSLLPGGTLELDTGRPVPELVSDVFDYLNTAKLGP